ncbi:RagB/SusD family nutrient uptake outer membrane protein [Epilithonimonas zeae]|uniref:SusD family protein n=1 Tax=Epilithonimonas zeae TaxID=1416779 RepID=A0A1N6ITX7_9FLAO|nr:RagB/SusD family nutrient uptake outer membrane protein [Epilithonimonas zeae]SIO35452.1 SusD family protein [Epilithonimonas zeae]
MKNKIFILGAFVALLGMSSCSDSFLEENYSEALNIPLDANTIKTNDDLQNSIRGLYASLANTNGFGGGYFTYQELTGDIGFVSIKNSGYFVSTNALNHLQVDGGASEGIWTAFYNTIANANLVLSYEGKIPDGKDGVVKSNTLFAHAKVIRAYNYLALLGLFSPNYGEGDQSLGVPYTTAYNITAKLPRETVPNVINSVIADLESSLAFFKADGFSAIYADNKSFNTNAVNLLLARAYLFKKDYTKAQQYAQTVIDVGGLLSTTSTSSPFSSMFLVTGENNAEVLFQIDFTNPGGSNSLSTYWGTAGTYKQNFMAKPFYDSFVSATGNDIRVKNTAWYQNNATTYPDLPLPINVRKYNNGFRDVIQLRKTEAIFIKAEAQYHSDPSIAFQTLKDWVLAYRDTGYSKMPTGTGVLDEILRQKGFEFFLEGTRFTDLKRNNKPIIKYQTGVDGNTLGSIPLGDRRFIWPIPLAEKQNNPNISQAPGY